MDETVGTIADYWPQLQAVNLAVNAALFVMGIIIWINSSCKFAITYFIIASVTLGVYSVMNLRIMHYDIIWCMNIPTVMQVVAGILYVKKSMELADIFHILNQEEQQIRDDEIRREEEIEALLNGTWFPSVEFYEICKENGISNMENEFYLKKAEKFVDDVLAKYNVKKEECKCTFSGDILKKYWADAETEIAAKKVEEEKQAAIRRRTPTEAKYNEKIAKGRESYKKAVQLYGIEKRKFLLQTYIDAISEEIVEKQKAKDSVDNLTMAVAMSAYKPKDKDWALLGGIADGIAGPGAGAAVALKAMSENAANAAQYEENRKYATNLAYQVSLSGLDIARQIDKLEENAEKFRKEIREAERKVILENVEFSELKDTFEIGNTKIKSVEDDECYVCAELSVINHYVPNVPKEVKMCVDGYLSVSLQEEDIYLGSVDVPLPALGVKCNGGKTTIEVIFDQYLPGKNHNYTCTVEPKKLWVMEV